MMEKSRLPDKIICLIYKLNRISRASGIYNHGFLFNLFDERAICDVCDVKRDLVGKKSECVCVVETIVLCKS